MLVGIQLVGMSATLSNISDLCRFLDAEMYSNDFRPVVLCEYIKLENKLYKINNHAKSSEERLHKTRLLNFSVSTLRKRAIITSE